jgi:hypothetical protein
MPRLLRRLLGAIPDLLIAAAYVAMLTDPLRGAGPQGAALWRAAVLEFFAVHASGFLKWTWVGGWSAGRRTTYVVALAAAYTAVMGGFALAVGDWWPIAVFWLLTGNRMLDAAVREAPRGREMEEEGRAWAGGVVLYVLAACVAGLGDMSRNAIFTAGALYFAANGLSELAGWGWVERWWAWSRSRS